MIAKNRLRVSAGHPSDLMSCVASSDHTKHMGTLGRNPYFMIAGIPDLMALKCDGRT